MNETAKTFAAMLAAIMAFSLLSFPVLGAATEGPSTGNEDMPSMEIADDVGAGHDGEAGDTGDDALPQVEPESPNDPAGPEPDDEQGLSNDGTLTTKLDTGGAIHAPEAPATQETVSVAIQTNGLPEAAATSDELVAAFKAVMDAGGGTVCVGADITLMETLNLGDPGHVSDSEIDMRFEAVGGSYAITIGGPYRHIYTNRHVNLSFAGVILDGSELGGGNDKMKKKGVRTKSWTFEEEESQCIRT